MWAIRESRHMSRGHEVFLRCTRQLAALLVVAMLTGCSLISLDSSLPQKVDGEQPPEKIYNDAMTLLTAGNPIRAVTFFQEVERQHPYSVWANKAILMTAYSQYEYNNYDEALITLDRFIRLHPGSRDIAYAYYLKALCYYEEIADIRRDQGKTKRAMDAMREVIRRFPQSKYARDAKLKLDLARDQIAGQEMSIGRWYQKNRHYLAALNRFKSVIDKYEVTSHVPEALHRMTESYLALGLTAEARKTAAVLGHNYPGSVWYSDSYTLMTGKKPSAKPVERSWLGSAWNSVF
jgi:outer membrane protein assembly factor BamD